MISNISQSLHGYSFSFNSQSQSQFFHCIRHTANFTQAKKNTKSRCFTTATNASLCYRLTCYAASCIYFTGMHCSVCIQYPCHFSFTRSIIGCRNISAGPDKIFPDQFRCISSCDLFKFVRRIFFWIDPDTTFTSSKWNIYNGAFVSHQRCKCHHLILVYFGGKTNTTFAWCFVLRMLYPVGFYYFYTSIISF